MDITASSTPDRAPTARAGLRVATGTVTPVVAPMAQVTRCRRATMAQQSCAREVRRGTQPADCMSCRLRDFGLTVGLSEAELDQLDDAVTTRRRVERGATLYTAGQPLRHVYAIRLGTFKTSLHTPDGREQVTGFQLQGELLGLDAVGAGRYLTDAIALEDSDVWAIGYADLIGLGERFPRVSHNLQKLLSREVAAAQTAMLVLGRMTAEERIAAFLLDLSRRYASLGWSATEFVLRMSRDDMANCLGIKIETVSRMLGRLQERGLIQVRQRDVRLLDPCGLERVFDESVTC